MSVLKVVLTLTIKSAEIYLLMAGAKQLSDTRFILVPAGAVRPAVVCSKHCIAFAPWCLQRGATSETEEKAEPPGPRGFVIEANADIV
jgi:hypothetical protein